MEACSKFAGVVDRRLHGQRLTDALAFVRVSSTTHVLDPGFPSAGHTEQ